MRAKNERVAPIYRIYLTDRAAVSGEFLRNRETRKEPAEKLIRAMTAQKPRDIRTAWRRPE
jgi:hypothetical protein